MEDLQNPHPYHTNQLLCYIWIWDIHQIRGARFAYFIHQLCGQCLSARRNQFLKLCEPFLLLVHMWPPCPTELQRVSQLFCELDPWTNPNKSAWWTLVIEKLELKSASLFQTTQGMYYMISQNQWESSRNSIGHANHICNRYISGHHWLRSPFSSDSWF